MRGCDFSSPSDCSIKWHPHCCPGYPVILTMFEPPSLPLFWGHWDANGHWEANKTTVKLDVPKYGCCALWELTASSCRETPDSKKQSFCNRDTHFYQRQQAPMERVSPLPSAPSRSAVCRCLPGRREFPEPGLLTFHRKLLIGTKT